MRIVPFKPEHIDRMREQGIQPSQAMDMLGKNPEYAAELAKAGIACSAVEGDRIIICSGVVTLWEGRGLAWALFPGDLGALFIGAHRAVKRFLDDCKLRRIEADIRTDFEPAHRWIKMLGFQRECTRRAYCPLGNDYDLYARVRTD